MNAEEQRRLGVRLATEANAPKTLAAIKDVDSCYETILKTAAEEVGVDRLVSVIKDQDSSWSHYALEYVGNLDGHRDALAGKAAAFAEAANAVQGNTSSFELYLATGAAFECRFTMFWQNEPNGPIYPAAAQSDPDSWVWSDKLSISINRQFTYDCSHFQLPGAPVSIGATVWLFVGIIAGASTELTQFKYQYQPVSGNIQIDATGTTGNPKYNLHTS